MEQTSFIKIHNLKKEYKLWKEVLRNEKYKIKNFEAEITADSTNKNQNDFIINTGFQLTR